MRTLKKDTKEHGGEGWKTNIDPGKSGGESEAKYEV